MLVDFESQYGGPSCSCPFFLMSMLMFGPLCSKSEILIFLTLYYKTIVIIGCTLDNQYDLFSWKSS